MSTSLGRYDSFKMKKMNSLQLTSPRYSVEVQYLVPSGTLVCPFLEIWIPKHPYARGGTISIFSGHLLVQLIIWSLKLPLNMRQPPLMLF